MENERSFNDLPQEVLWDILFRLPVKTLLVLRSVSKTWFDLISDPNFAKSHFELTAPTRRCLFVQRLEALSCDIDALFHDGRAAVKVSLPGKKPSPVNVLGSCRGFVMLDMYLHFVIWNPSTGAHQRISYPHAGSRSKAQKFLYGFGYDASKDDYLVVLGWRDKKKEDHMDFFSMRTNSWRSFEVALPNPLIDMRRCALFFNGAFHWLASPGRHDYPILVFDPEGRRFSEIPLPEQVELSGRLCGLMELEGCLALYSWNDESKPEIWMMKEYKVQSSWTSYGIFHEGFIPISVSRDGDITGYDITGYVIRTSGSSKYNVIGQKIELSSCQLNLCGRFTMYTESVLPLPNYSKGREKGSQVHQECFEQLDAITNNNHNKVKERKRVRRVPTWTRDFYCN